LLEEFSYREAIELAYYGASVIHPKTIQPLQQKDIPLYVRSFLHPELPGTVIKKGLLLKPLVPCYIRKTDQLLISINTRDLAFIVEEHLQLIYSIFHTHGVMVNVMQNSAISSSFCVNNDTAIVPRALAELEKHFDVRTNDNLQLYTVRHHNAQSRKALRGDREPLIEQVTRQTYQVVMG
jgi:aspartate kinase